MKIETVTDSSLPSFIRLWQMTFGDSEESIRAFLGHFGDELQAFVLENEGQVRSALTRFRMGNLHGPLPAASALPVWTSYAICTDPRARDQGFASALTDFNRLEVLRQGGCSMLSPASQDLTGFYEPLGYRPAFLVEEQTVPASGSRTELYATRIGRAEYGALREELLKNTVHVRLSQKTLALEEICCAGGGFFRCTEHDMIFTLEKKADGMMYLPEILRSRAISEKELLTTVSAIASRLRQKEILFRTPALKGSGTARVQAMISGPEDRIKGAGNQADPHCPESASGTDFAPYFGFPFD